MGSKNYALVTFLKLHQDYVTKITLELRNKVTLDLR